MSERHSSLVVGQLKLTPEQMQMVQENWEQFLQIFNQQLREQAKTNEMLASLLQALADDQAEQDPDAIPTTFLDGTPCR